MVFLMIKFGSELILVRFVWDIWICLFFQVRVLYVRNLSPDTTEERLMQIFSAFVEPSRIEKIKKLRDFAFVHFQTRDDAKLALELLNGQPEQ